MYRNGIAAKAQELGYSQANMLILAGNLSELAAKFPATYRNLLTCEHNRDKRTPLEYARDLVASWIFEDTMVQTLTRAGITISLAGTDQKREILASSRVSSCSDCRVSLGSVARGMEIMSDYTGWWESTGWIDLRDDKYLRLKREHSLFLGVSTTSRRYLLLDFGEDIPARYIESHVPYGGKPAYAINVEPTALKKFLVPNLVADIRKALNGS